MTRSRREFLIQAGILGTTLAGAACATAGSRGQRSPFERSKSSEKLMGLLGLDYPIIQAPMGSMATPRLAVAVSNAGALGALGLWVQTADAQRSAIEETRRGTTRPFLGNFVLLRARETDVLKAIDAGCPVLHFSWGMPSVDVRRAADAARARFGVQVSNADGALRARDLGAVYVVVQGLEAGGHVQASASWRDTLPEVLRRVPELPVLVAGGIGDGKTMREALDAGAAGVMLGTRFIATRECIAHAEYKAALVRASAHDAILTQAFTTTWIANFGALRTATTEMYEAAGCPAVGQRPGETDVLGTRGDGSPILRYQCGAPRENDTGRIAEMCLLAGKGVGDIRDVPTVGELLKRMWAECIAA